MRHGALGRYLLAFALAAPFAAASVEITAIEVTVADLPRALAFYTAVLQFQLLSQAENAGRVTAGAKLESDLDLLRRTDSRDAARGRAVSVRGRCG